MSTSNLPVILIELVLVFGGTLAFGWWQLRSVRRDRERMARERAARAAPTSRQAPAPAAPPAEDAR